MKKFRTLAAVFSVFSGSLADLPLIAGRAVEARQTRSELCWSGRLCETNLGSGGSPRLLERQLCQRGQILPPTG